MTEINWKKRMIFAGIVFFIILLLTFYTHSESVWNAFPFHLWSIPNTILWAFIIAFILTFIDYLYIVVFLYIIFIFAGDFIFVGIYRINWLSLLWSFAPHTNNLEVKALFYGFYAIVILLLFLPFLISHYVQPHRKRNKWVLYAFSVLAVLVLISAILHFSSEILFFGHWLIARLWSQNIVIDTIVYTVIGIFVLWGAWFLVFGEILIFDWLFERKFWREWDKGMHTRGDETKGNYTRSEEGREHIKEPVKENRRDENDNSEPLELQRRKLAVEGAYWQHQYASAKTESDKRRANDKLRELNEKVKKTKS